MLFESLVNVAFKREVWLAAPTYQRHLFRGRDQRKISDALLWIISHRLVCGPQCWPIRSIPSAAKDPCCTQSHTVVRPLPEKVHSQIKLHRGAINFNKR